MKPSDEQTGTLILIVLILALVLFGSIVADYQQQKQRTHIYYCMEPQTGSSMPCKFNSTTYRDVLLTTTLTESS